jgi:hypothetical protein
MLAAVSHYREIGLGKWIHSGSEGDALLDVYFVRPESLLNSFSIEHGISDRCGVLLQAEWKDNYCRPQVERLVLVYTRANVLGLHTVLQDKLAILASNGRCVEEVGNHFKARICEGIERFLPHKLL